MEGKAWRRDVAGDCSLKLKLKLKYAPEDIKVLSCVSSDIAVCDLTD
jgi:hypothetical protein